MDDNGLLEHDGTPAAGDNRNHHDGGIDDNVSPIAPRFCKESHRGVKRHLEFGKYKAEASRKKAVCDDLHGISLS